MRRAMARTGDAAARDVPVGSPPGVLRACAPMLLRAA